MAEAIAARHGAASRAVLFYGSCLREKQLDGLMLDFYLIVSDYRAAYDKPWLARANALIPPNVFPFQHDGLAAKYAVLSEADFHRLNGPETRNVSVWARFAQPSRLVWVGRRGRARRARSPRSRAPRRPCSRQPGRVDGRGAARLVAPGVCADLFGRASRRAQGPQRLGRRCRSPIATSASPPPALAAIEPGVASGGWARRRIEGKALSVAAPRQGQRDLCRRRRIYRVEDQSPRRHRHRAQAVAEAPPACSARSACCRGSSDRARSARPPDSARATAAASALTVNGLRSSS